MKSVKKQSTFLTNYIKHVLEGQSFNLSPLIIKFGLNYDKHIEDKKSRKAKSQRFELTNNLYESESTK